MRSNASGCLNLSHSREISLSLFLWIRQALTAVISRVPIDAADERPMSCALRISGRKYKFHYICDTYGESYKPSQRSLCVGLAVFYMHSKLIQFARNSSSSTSPPAETMIFFDEQQQQSKCKQCPANKK